MASIDLDTLREMLASAEMMIPYYERESGKTARENAAMVAAGLDPIHHPATVKGAAQSADRCRRQVEVLRYLIAYHSGEVFAGEVAA